MGTRRTRFGFAANSHWVAQSAIIVGSGVGLLTGGSIMTGVLLMWHAGEWKMEIPPGWATSPEWAAWFLLASAIGMGLAFPTAVLTDCILSWGVEELPPSDFPTPPPK